MGDPRNTYRAGVRVTLWQAGLLIAKILSVACVAASHWLLNRVASFVAPAGLDLVVYFLEVVFFGCFSVIYVHAAYDIVTIFVPILRKDPQQAASTGEHR